MNTKTSSETLLQVDNLSVNFTVHGGEVKAVRSVSFDLKRGEMLCIVGESGCGKSVTMQAVMGLLPMPPAKLLSGKAMFEGKDLFTLTDKERRRVLGKEISMIFQDPLTSLNPTMTVENQIREMLDVHTGLTKQEKRARVLELLQLVRIPEPQKRLEQYPHELSGGMRQRVMIAIALACNPKVLIADEPTTALDVTIQAQILTLMKELAQRLNMATVLITHDLGVVAQMAHRVLVMYAGKIVEEGSVDDIFYAPKHPYTIGLRAAMPQKDAQGKPIPLKPIPGTPPDLFSPPKGCAFAPRCPHAMVVCQQQQPPEILGADGKTRVACWLHNEQATQEQRRQSGVTLISSQMSV